MRQIWSITVEDYMEVVKRAREAGVKPGESIEAVFIDYMNEKGQKSCGATELNKEELLSELVRKNGKILEINTTPTGETTYNILKKTEENI
jgi:hypothetical protein